MSLDIRKVQQLSDSTTGISIPKEYGFKRGDLVKFERLDDKTFKIVKIA